jgi:hypothetical protein
MRSMPVELRTTGRYCREFERIQSSMGGVDNKTTHQITFTTGHLSGYAVAF